MAVVPLNLFRNLTIPLSTSGFISSVYTAPKDRAAILLTSQVANITDTETNITAAVSGTSNNTLVYLISGYKIPPYDAANILMGKIVLVEGDRLLLYSNKNNALNVTLSILETINTAT